MSQFLNERGVLHRVVEDQGQQLLEVDDPQLIPELRAFIANLKAENVVLPVEQVKPSQKPGQSGFWEAIRFTPVSAWLILLSCLGALLVQLDETGQWLRWVTFQDIGPQGFVPLGESLRQGQVWRLLTPAFIHFGIFHILFNSLWVWDLGRRLELYLGRKEYLLFFAVTGVLANISQYLWSGPSLFGGMSGVIYAFVGYLACAQRLTSHPLLAVPKGLIAFMVGWLVLCMTGAIDLLISGGVANGAHLGGLIAGFVYALLRHRLLARFLTTSP